ncbi:MAG: transposase [bacterium]|nr:transposase [bacterium]
MARKEQFAENEFYHIYNRGTDKRTIFLDEFDYGRFIRLLHVCNNQTAVVMKDLKNFNFSQLTSLVSQYTPLVAIGAYCLMPNHFHILVKEIRPRGISQFMGKLLTAYSMYFNKKYERTGALFEGKFKSSRAKNDNYLQYLFAYIHLNPVKLIDPNWKEEGIQDIEKAHSHLLQYPHSSYLDFTGEKRPEGAILNRDPDVFPAYFDNFKEFNEFIDAWLTYAEQ